MISIPVNDNGPVDPPEFSLRGRQPLNALYADAYLNDEADSDALDQTPEAQGSPAKALKDKTAASAADKFAVSPDQPVRAKRRRRSRSAQTTEAGGEPSAEEPAENTAEKAVAQTPVPVDRADVAAMVASPVEGTKALGLKLDQARRDLAKSKDAERLRAIPDATPENPDPWVSETGASAGLAPIPPKGTAPALTKGAKKGVKKNGSTDTNDAHAIPTTDSQPAETGADFSREAAAAPENARNRTSGQEAARAIVKETAKGKAKAKGRAAPKTGAKAVRTAGLIESLVTSADDGLAAGLETVQDEKADTPTEPLRQIDTETALTATEPAEAADVNPDDPRYRDDGVPTGLVEDIAPKRLSAKEIRQLPGRIPTNGSVPAFPDDEDDESPAVAALMTGDWLSEALPIRTAYRHDEMFDTPENGEADAVPNAKAAMPDSFEEEEADFARHRTPSQPPQPDWSDERGGRIPDANYAMRMDAWEKAVIAEDIRKGCDIPEQHRPRDVRENLGTGTDTTVAGFPAPVPLRKWVTENGEPVRADAADPNAPQSAPADRVSAWSARWTSADRSLRLALTALFTVVTGALSGWLSARIALPAIVAESTPVAIAAIVREEDVRELMVLANVLEEKAHTHRRAPLSISPVYLPDSLLTPEGEPLEGLLTDLHFRAALKEAADRLGAPVMSASTVLAIPNAGKEKHPLATRTLDITEDVKTLLGLSGLESAALKDLLKEWLKNKDENASAAKRRSRTP